MRGTLQSCLRSDGTPRPATSSHQVAVANKQFTPIQGSVSNLQLVTKSDVKDYIIGDQVLAFITLITKITLTFKNIY